MGPARAAACSRRAARDRPSSRRPTRGPLVDIWGSLSGGLGRGDASGVANVLPLLVAAVAGAAGGGGAVLAQSGDGAVLAQSGDAASPAELDWTLNLPGGPAPDESGTVFENGSRRCLSPTKTPPGLGSPLFDGSLLAQAQSGGQGGDRAPPPAWLDPDWSLLGSPGATPGTALAADAFPDAAPGLLGGAGGVSPCARLAGKKAPRLPRSTRRDPRVETGGSSPTGPCWDGSPRWPTLMQQMRSPRRARRRAARFDRTSPGCGRIRGSARS